jgi:hypothetical protein
MLFQQKRHEGAVCRAGRFPLTRWFPVSYDILRVPKIRPHFFAFTTAIAVLLVSATCTSAGCLLQFDLAREAGGNQPPPCCLAHANHAGDPSPGHHDGHCPLCRNSVLIGKAVDHAHPNFAHSLLCSAIFSVVTPGQAAVPQAELVANRSATSPTNGPPTLLALHCALLV